MWIIFLFYNIIIKCRNVDKGRGDKICRSGRGGGGQTLSCFAVGFTLSKLGSVWEHFLKKTFLLDLEGSLSAPFVFNTQDIYCFGRVVKCIQDA